MTPDTILINDNDRADLPDDWEVAYGLNPANGDPALGEGKLGDFDGDGSSNYLEFLNNTDPKDFTSYPSLLPRIVKTIPFYHPEEAVTSDVPDASSFGVLVVDKGRGINTTTRTAFASR